MRSRSFGMCVGLGAAFLALKPIGGADRLSRVMLVPGRVVAALGAPTTLLHSARRPESSGADAANVEAEAALSLRLERALLRSAWPQTVPLGRTVVPVPGEVEGRIGSDRDRLTLRVSDTRDVAIGQPVVMGDVYIGSIDRIPYAEHRPDRPGTFERLLRLVGLSSAPRRSPEDIVEVALITGKASRVGARVTEDQDGYRCRLVTGGLVPMEDRIWLAIHNPESRASRSGMVRVHEPLGFLDGFDSLAEDFLLGELVTESLLASSEDSGDPSGDSDGDPGGDPGGDSDGGPDANEQRDAVGRVFAGTSADPFATEVRGIRPLVDFGSGLNQVLVLTRSDDSGRSSAPRGPVEPIPVLEDDGWRSARWLAIGDTSAWRSTARIGRGRRGGVSIGAAVVDGVRLVGRVLSVDPLGAAVALVDDPGLQLNVLAQSVDDPDAEPLVLGRVTSAGRSLSGELLLRWEPETSSAYGDWITARGASGKDAVPVRIWTASGLSRVPRGLLVGACELPREVTLDAEGGMRMRLRSTGQLGASARVRVGGARLQRAADAGTARAMGGAAPAAPKRISHGAEAPR